MTNNLKKVEFNMSNNFKDFMTNNFSEEEKAELKQDAENLVSKYAHMTQSELSMALYQEVANQKANGTFDKNKLLYMLESIKSMLPQDAYQSMYQALMNL